MKLRSVQRSIWANKRVKGFNTTDVPLELCLLQGEVAELFQAWRRQMDTVGEELADVAIYVLGLAEMLHVDLETEIVKKIEVNKQRRYQSINGTPLKVAEGDRPAKGQPVAGHSSDIPPDGGGQLLLFPPSLGATADGS